MIAERFERSGTRGAERGAEARESHATVLFVDVKGFTATAERLAPARLARWLTSWLEAMTAVIRSKGGEVEQLLGDGLVATFAGHPRVTSGDAAAAALAMAAALAELNRGFAERGWPAITMRIGIATGSVARSSLALGGGAVRILLGDPVNVAARLEALDEALAPVPQSGARILLDGATAAWLDDPARLEPLGARPLKGRAGRVAILALSAGSPPVAE